ncbi:MAG TPA: hypothetical protein VHC70_07815 [Phycisphaerales bacterium]|nr:hypothetical protein [Phycisphaerales bacterium]
MTICKVLCVAGIVGSVSAVAIGQPVNGKLKPEYGPLQWSNTTPTGFGNAGIATAPPCDPIGGGVQVTLNNSNRAGIDGGTGAASLSAAAAVTAGYEMKIPLASLGLNPSSLPPTITIRVAGLVINDNFGTSSNQFIGGLGGIDGATSPNTYPAVNTIDLTTVPGDQFATITASGSLANGQPILDGSLDAAFYGAPVFVQDTQTNFGDSVTPQASGQSIFFDHVPMEGGSEIDAVYGRVSLDASGDPTLYLFVAGNFESNYNKLALFFDSIAGGQNQVRNDNATQTGTYGSVSFGGANACGGPGTGTNPGLKFDAGFEADYFLVVNVGGPNDVNPTIYADWQRLRTSPTDAGSGRYLGSTQATSATPTILTASDPCPPFVEPDYHDVANGSEIDSVYAMVCGNYLHVLVTGNLENNGNRLDLFFDVGTVFVPQQSIGQNQLLGNEHPFDYGHLNRLGTDPNSTTAPGLKFSAGFDADYWLSIETTNNPVNLNAYAGLINSNGALNDAGFPAANYLEYGGIAGGEKATNNPLVFDGQKCIRFDMNNMCAPNGAGTVFNPTPIPGLDIQGDSGTNGLPLIAEPYTSFAPRLISADVYNPLGVDDSANGYPVPAHGDLTMPGLISVSLDNSNFGGVDGGTDATRARQVTTGVEVKIRLDELGYSGSGPIKLAGFIVSQDHSYVSNQVIGGALPPGAANLGEPRTIDFDALGGTGPFYITIDPGNCATVATGACCFDASTCSLMSSTQCTTAGGQYIGDATACSPSPCGASTGVCCRGSTCAVLTQAECTTTGLAGAFFAQGSNCNAAQNTTSPCCYPDYNKTGGITVGDIFDFLNDWFAGRPYAIVGGNGSTGQLQVQNIFDFLNAWFAGGC